MSGPSTRLVIAVIGAVIGVLATGVALNAGWTPQSALLHLAIGLTYVYGGLAIWSHDPANRTGPLMTSVGLTWFIQNLEGSGLPILNVLGLALGDTWSVVLVALVLAYPGGRLETRVDRVAVAVLAVGATALTVLYAVPVPLVINEGNNGLYGALLLAIVIATVVVRRWLIAPATSRRELLPVLVAGAVFVTFITINILRRLIGVPDDVGAILVAVFDLAPAAIPVALLVGFYRQSEQRLAALLDAIPDQMIRFTRDGTFVGPDETDPGSAAKHPGGFSSRRLHAVIFADARVPALEAARQALDTGELRAFDFSPELTDGRRNLEVRVAPSGRDEVTAIIRDFTVQRAIEEEVRRSRVRIVEATDAARRKLERDLHDGAQQRLVSLSLMLRMLRNRLAGPGASNDEAIAAADAASAELRTAAHELRELARGIHPAVLTEAGLGAAINGLAGRSTVPAVVSSVPDRGLPAAVEATAYFIVSEALANIAKYSSATAASISVECDDAALRVVVGDDGVGGADESRGTGIRGLHDRVNALGGRLTVDSPPGQGTLLVATIPIA
jgi:signal transduction histidine kinase